MTADQDAGPVTREELTRRTREVVAALRGPAALPFLHDDVVVEEPDFLPYGGTHHGIEGFRAVMAAASQVLDLSRTTFHGVLADGEDAVRFLRATLRGSGDQVSIAEEVRLREGRVAAIRVFWFDHPDLLPTPTP